MKGLDYSKWDHIEVSLPQLNVRECVVLFGSLWSWSLLSVFVCLTCVLSSLHVGRLPATLLLPQHWLSFCALEFFTQLKWRFRYAQCYGQFGELSWKNQRLLEAVRRFEVRLIGYYRINPANVLHCYCIHCHQFWSRDINRFINLKLTNISTFNYEFTITKG